MLCVNVPRGTFCNMNRFLFVKNLKSENYD